MLGWDEDESNEVSWVYCTRFAPVKSFILRVRGASYASPDLKCAKMCQLLYGFPLLQRTSVCNPWAVLVPAFTYLTLCCLIHILVPGAAARFRLSIVTP